MVKMSFEISSSDRCDLDAVIRKKKFMNRSDAMRDYLRRGVREDLGSESNEKEQAQHICNSVPSN